VAGPWSVGLAVACAHGGRRPVAAGSGVGSAPSSADGPPARSAALSPRCADAHGPRARPV